MIAPIDLEYWLRCSPATAFATYTERIGEWWHPRYSRDAATLRSVTIEPFVGGRVFASHGDGEDDWGVVRSWEPDRLLVHTFTLAQDVNHPTEVRVEFVTAPDGCVMLFSHGGWDDSSAVVRSKFGDWPVMLERMATLATDEWRRES